ncbi:MAG: HlyC/CorC family transporter [Parvularculaceae bacterium]|nr:HlyC/CorC family transporter [Parvularculaceae bacterium]
MPDGSEPSKSAALSAPKTEPAAEAASSSHPDPTSAPRRRRGLGGLFGRRPAAEPVVEQATNGNGRQLSAAETAMIERVVELQNLRVGDVAIPRADIIAIDVESSIKDILNEFADAGHSRLPVFRGDLDDPLGFVHIKDVVGILAEGNATDDDQPLESIVRKLIYAPPSMPVAELLLRMQAQRIHMGLVIDEFGGTDGLVSIEDLIEEIVGDIRDEHDETDDLRIKETPGGRWDCDARVELEFLAEKLDRDLRLDEEEADTLGGLVFSLAGRVPLRGEVISHPHGHEFEIAEADPRLVRRVLIKLHTDPVTSEMAPK